MRKYMITIWFVLMIVGCATPSQDRNINIPIYNVPAPNTQGIQDFCDETFGTTGNYKIVHKEDDPIITLFKEAYNNCTFLQRNNR